MTKTWEEGCESAAAKVLNLYGQPAAGSDNYVEWLRSQVDAAADAPASGPYDWMGGVALRRAVTASCEESGRTCIQRIQKLLAAKQHDYGHGNINRFGLFGIVVRLSDKLARLENLTERADQIRTTVAEDPDDVFGEQALNESIADTWDDIVGYCVIALMVLDGTFDLELEADQEPEHPLTSLPGGATTCIDDIGNTYKLRDNGVWEFIGAHSLIPNNFKWEN